VTIWEHLPKKYYNKIKKKKSVTIWGQGLYKKCNSPGIFPGLVVFLGVFFSKISKKSQKQSGSEYCNTKKA